MEFSTGADDKLLRGSQKASLSEVSPLKVISRVVLLLCLFLVIYLGYRLWVVRMVDTVYKCVENVISSVDSLNEVVDGSEGVLVTEAQDVFDTATKIGIRLEKNSTCISASGGGNKGDLVDICSKVSVDALKYVLVVEEVSGIAAEGGDTYDMQSDIVKAYETYRASVSECEKRIESNLEKVSL